MTAIVLSLKICQDIAEDFANRPTECITWEAFNETAQEMLKFYPESDMSHRYPRDKRMNVEMHLRNKLFRHNQALLQLAKDYETLAKDYKTTGHSDPRMQVFHQRFTPQVALSEHVDSLVIGEARQMSRFYRELTEAVSNQNKEIRYNVLHQIIHDLHA